MNSGREQWKSRLGFILAAAGSAVGLGNIWKFPYLVGQNGGSAFILIYLVCVMIIGLPLVMAEIVIGRTAQRNPVGSFRLLAKGNPLWIMVGGLGVVAGFCILSYYNAIAGWSLGYIFESIAGGSLSDSASITNTFQARVTSPWWALTTHLGFMLLTVGIIYGGVVQGIEKASKIMMPLLFILLIILVIRGVTLQNSLPGILYILKPDFSLINSRTFLTAMGQAFFSLSLGMGALLTYGSYMSRQESIPQSSVSIVLLDTLIALLAGFMIFPAVFAFGMQPDQGPALIFNLVPLIFNHIPGGAFFRVIFFILLSLAALTSTISLLEVITAYAIDELGFTRRKAALLFGGLTFLIGVPSALSFGVLSRFKIFNLDCFSFMDFISSNLFLPVGGFFIAIFVGWYWPKKEVQKNLWEGTQSFPTWLMTLWHLIIRYLSPVIILLIFLHSLNII
jgi:NSS family neurotransmitter:Na+ symporter